MVVGELDEVDYDLEIDGEQVRKQLARRVWERGGWATVVCAFAERANDGEWKAAKVAVLRFRKVHDAWKRQAAITLAGDEALALAGAITGWRAEIAQD